MFFAYRHSKNHQGGFGGNCWQSKDFAEIFEAPVCGRPEKDKNKKSLPPLLIVGAGWITAGLRKGEEESLPSDLNIPPQQSEHVLRTRKPTSSSTA